MNFFFANIGSDISCNIINKVNIIHIFITNNLINTNCYINNSIFLKPVDSLEVKNLS